MTRGSRHPSNQMAVNAVFQRLRGRAFISHGRWKFNTAQNRMAVIPDVPDVYTLHVQHVALEIGGESANFPPRDLLVNRLDFLRLVDALPREHPWRRITEDHAALFGQDLAN